jgi:hypothetical protein
MLFKKIDPSLSWSAAAALHYRQALRRCHRPLHYPVGKGFRLYMRKGPNKMRQQCVGGLVEMWQFKTFGTALSLMVIACSIVVASWVVLALLGF